MAREQSFVNLADDPNDSTAVVVTIDGLGNSYPKAWFFDYSQFDLQHAVQNLKIRKQLDNLGDIRSDNFRSGINGAGGIECTDTTRYLVSVSDQGDGTFNLQFGKTVDAADFGCFVGLTDLDTDTSPAGTDHVAKNVKCSVRVLGFTQMNAATYSAINARLFWR